MLEQFDRCETQSKLSHTHSNTHTHIHSNSQAQYTVDLNLVFLLQHSHTFYKKGAKTISNPKRKIIEKETVNGPLNHMLYIDCLVALDYAAII